MLSRGNIPSVPLLHTPTSAELSNALTQPSYFMVIATATAATNLAISPGTVANQVDGQVAFDETDCSNPQQGTGRRSSSSSCMVESPPTASVGVVQGRATSPLTTGDSDDRSEASKRSAQNVSGRKKEHEKRSAYKIPPTLKDSRKLFVGGLPMDGTSHVLRYAAMGAIFIPEDAKEYCPHFCRRSYPLHFNATF